MTGKKQSLEKLQHQAQNKRQLEGSTFGRGVTGGRAALQRSN